MYLGAAILSSGIALWAFGLFSADWRIPIDYRGDAFAVAAHFKTVLETGWYEFQPALGAPFGQVYFDYPISDNLHFVVVKLLGLVVNDVGVVMNVYFLLGFPLAAVAMVWFLERMGVSGYLALPMGVLFAIAPYHFWRGEGHMFLAAYFVVPPALWIVVRTARGWSVFKRAASGRGLRRYLNLSNAGTVAVIVILGSASAYYSVFVLILLAFAGVGALVVRRRVPFWHAMVSGAMIALVVLANMVPDLIHRLIDGTNPEAMVRTPVETEIYAFKLAQLLLPAPGHQFEPFRRLRELYDAHYPLPSEGPALGMVGAVGLIALFVFIGVVLVRSTRIRDHTSSELAKSLSALSFLAFVAFLFGSVGGLSTFVSFVTTSVRAWNRLSILVLALSLAAAALLIDELLRRLVRRVPHPWTGAVAGVSITVALLIVGVWDQVPVGAPGRAADEREQYRSDAELVAVLERRLPANSAILQLPYIPFPENAPVNGVLDTEQLRFYLHSHALRWSAGGIKGSPGTAEIAEVASTEPPVLIDSALRLGYSAILIDAKALDDNARTLAASLEEALGEPVVSEDGRFFVYVF